MRIGKTLLQLIVCSALLLCNGLLTRISLGDAPTLDYCKPAGLQRGTTATIELSGKFDWPIQVDCPGAMVECLEEKGKLLVGVAGDLAADRLWLRIYNDEGASNSKPLLIGNLKEVTEQEPNNRTEQAQDLSHWLSSEHFPSIIVNGVLEKSGDIDGYSVPLQAGQTLVADVQANERFGSPIDAILQIAATDGTVLDENHDAVGLDPRIVFKAPKQGTYCVRIFAWPSQPNQRIQYQGSANYIYRLTLATGPYLLNPLPAQVPSDATEAKVAVRGWNLAGTNELPVRSLSKRIEQVLPEHEAAEVPALADSSIGLVGLPTASYQPANVLRVRRLPTSLKVNTATPTSESPLEMDINSVLSGTIGNPKDEHVFTVQGKKNQLLTASVESIQLHSLLVPWLRIMGSDDQVLAKTRVSGTASDASLDFEVPEDGVYRFVIRDRFQGGSIQHFYRFTVMEANPDFELSVTSEQYTLEPDEPLEVEVAVKRRNSGSEPIGKIAIEALDLPDGVSCEPVSSEPSGDSKNKVKLSLKSTGTPFSGRIRFRGTHDGIERYAKAPARFGASFDRIWLTVLPKKDPAQDVASNDPTKSP